MSGPIQTYLRLLFTEAGTSVTQDILPDLLSFSYDDKETNEADEISLTLKDPTAKLSELTSHQGRLTGRRGVNCSVESSSSIHSGPVDLLVFSRCVQSRFLSTLRSVERW